MELKEEIDYYKPKDPSKVSVYGRNEIGTENKPLIPNIEFKNLLDKVISRDSNAYNEAKQKYSFESRQKSLLDYYNSLLSSIGK